MAAGVDYCEMDKPPLKKFNLFLEERVVDSEGVSSPRERYFCDVKFMIVVDAMLRLMESGQFAPFELKQALALALEMYKERKAYEQ